MEFILKIEFGGICDVMGIFYDVDVIVEVIGFCFFDILDYVNVEGLNGLKFKDVWVDKVDFF